MSPVGQICVYEFALVVVNFVSDMAMRDNSDYHDCVVDVSHGTYKQNFEKKTLPFSPYGVIIFTNCLETGFRYTGELCGLKPLKYEERFTHLGKFAHVFVPDV